MYSVEDCQLEIRGKTITTQQDLSRVDDTYSELANDVNLINAASRSYARYSGAAEEF